MLLWKTEWQFLNKLSLESSYDLAIPLLGIYPSEDESRDSSRHL